MQEMLLVGRCGLYCDLCTERIAESCHGCGCECNACGAQYHREHCAIYRCVTERGLLTCADCPEMPCTRLIHFAYDPIWRTHRPVIENLRRIRRIGVEAWLEEQRAYFDDERLRQRWLDLHRECSDLHRQRRRQNPA
jgi:hypothetical protein